MFSVNLTSIISFQNQEENSPKKSIFKNVINFLRNKKLKTPKTSEFYFQEIRLSEVENLCRNLVNAKSAQLNTDLPRSRIIGIIIAVSIKWG